MCQSIFNMQTVLNSSAPAESVHHLTPLEKAIISLGPFYFMRVSDLSSAICGFEAKNEAMLP